LTLFSSFHLEVDSGRNVGGLLAACATLISTHAGSRQAQGTGQPNNERPAPQASHS
jgi:hypothetical protein